MKKLLFLIFSLYSVSLFAKLQLSVLPLNEVGKVAQFDINENGELIVINQQQELWKVNSTEIEKLAEGFSIHIEPNARYGRVAAADQNGNFILWTPEKIYNSSISLSENATMLSLNLATIAVAKQNGMAKLVRIETGTSQAHIAAVAEMEVLPDAHPLQINFENEEVAQGHIAILSKPDNTTYQHGVLGDNIEATEIQFLERHNLKPLASYRLQAGLVFEANRFSSLSKNGNTYLISVISGKGKGARTALINIKDGHLNIDAESTPLPSNRWQSPFSFNGKVYAVQMPHLRGDLVEYKQQGNFLKPHLIISGLSNHSYGSYETNLATSTQNFAVVPKAGYRQVIILNKDGQMTELSTILPSEIQQAKSSTDKSYLRLKNGDIWVLEDK